MLVTNSKANSKGLVNLIKRNFPLYFPKKQLLFINHKDHGKVYPVYIADEEFNKKNNPKKLLPLVSLFSGLNLFLFLSGLQIIPLNFVYNFIHYYGGARLLLLSLGSNLYFLRKYLMYLKDYDERVKAMYLLPSGDKLIMETFDGHVSKLDNYDIYDYKLTNNYFNLRKQNKNSVWINNENGFSCKISWGLARESFFLGKRKLLDYEIFSQIISRQNIDTTIVKGSKQSYGIYTDEDKKKILSAYRKKPRYIIEKIDQNHLLGSYYRLKYKHGLLKKKVKRKIKEDLRLF